MELEIIIFLMGIVSLGIAIALLRSLKNDELSNNEKVKKWLLKKYGYKIKKLRTREKMQRSGRGRGMKYHNAKGVGGGYFQNNIGHWDANRFDPVGDQRKLRGESP